MPEPRGPDAADDGLDVLEDSPETAGPEFETKAEPEVRVTVITVDGLDSLTDGTSDKLTLTDRDVLLG